ncbi:MAG: hypothetical protein OXE59_08980 [Bacteroidetes bacterium]|nr:hypothetical protein [Bacteroidota bacterium]
MSIAQAVARGGGHLGFSVTTADYKEIKSLSEKTGLTVGGILRRAMSKRPITWFEGRGSWLPAWAGEKVEEFNENLQKAWK